MAAERAPESRDVALSFLSLLTGSFSTPAAENPTVAMVEAAYRDLGLDARYINCDVAPDALGDAVRGARAMGWKGFNCSLPHKVTVIEHLDGLAESAALIGAVNCVVDRDGRWIGENTDGKGFVASLRTVVDPAGASLVLLGAGGAARAIAVESALAGVASITVVNRDRGRGEELADTDLRVDVGVVRALGGRVRAVGATSSSTRPRSGWPDGGGDAAGGAVGRVGRRGRDSEPAADAPDPRGGGARLHDARRDRDARRAGVVAIRLWTGWSRMRVMRRRSRSCWPRKRRALGVGSFRVRGCVRSLAIRP